MIKKIILIFVFLHISLIAKDTNALAVKNVDKKVYIVNYIKNKYLKNKIKNFYLSFNDRFIGTKIAYKELKDDTFYQDFRTHGLSFLHDFMVKENYNAIIIFYQKKEKKKITIISQKRKGNVPRSVNVSSKKLPKSITYEKLISKSLKMLGELLIIAPKNRVF